MHIDIIFSGIILFFVVKGWFKGFIGEFLSLFKALLSVLVLKFFMPLSLKYSVPTNNTNVIDQTIDYYKWYVIMFGVSYGLFTVVSFLSRRFLKGIKLHKLNGFLGAIVGLVKASFIVFIIYIGVVLFTNVNKDIEEKASESYLMSYMTKYLYGYSEVFPSIIGDQIINYRQKQLETELKDNIMKDFEDKEKERNEIN